MLDAANRLAMACHKATQAGQVADACGQELDALIERHDQAQARHDRALEALRSGELDENAAAARMAVARADLADLEPLIDAAHQRVEGSNQAFQQAEAAVLNAEATLTRQEREADFDAIGNQIKVLESKLLVALHDRYRLGCELNGKRGTLFNFWEPSPDLREAVTQMIPPPVQRSWTVEAASSRK
jgi:chromosome segregation ATPase